MGQDHGLPSALLYAVLSFSFQITKIYELQALQFKNSLQKSQWQDTAGCNLMTTEY